jgi:hypothetical protein
MSHRFRTESQEEEAEKELIVDDKPAQGLPDNFFTRFLRNGVITSDDAISALPFVFYIAFLCMVYIGARHLTDNNIREIDKVGNEVKKLSAEYKSIQAGMSTEYKEKHTVKGVHRFRVHSFVRRRGGGAALPRAAGAGR